MKLVDFLRARLDEDEALAREASGSTVAGEPGNWKPSPAGDEWEVSRDDGYADELLVALRPNLPRPPEVLGGYWGVVVGYRWESEEPGSGAPLAEFKHAARHDPARVLTDIEAKREVVRLAERAHDYHESFMNGFAAALEQTLRMFARAYRDHPDFDPAWLED